MQTIVETPDYLADAKRTGLSDEERVAIAAYLALHPDAGTEIVGTGGARKVRFAGRGKGKSGGYRVITFFSGPAIPVFLLAVFAKGDKVDLTQGERNDLRSVLQEIADYYKAGVRAHVQRRKKTD
ncbi:MAG: type II toxin-antitoxin system RelE/ParE family toxin [Rhodospirillales bacterium]|nr:type II toxin-antitoxin system RelE/ParE family toxin [Rhodospirillales bacterium]